MKIFISYLFISIVFFSCKPSSSSNDMGQISHDEDSVGLDKQNPIDGPISKSCYGFHQNGDVINFNITSATDSVHGDLEYALAEKDKNSGKFSGMIQGDKLIGTYTFSSEGMISKRQMAFMIKDDRLIEGFGDVDEVSSGVVFKDTSSLKYDMARALIKDNCR